MRTLAQRIAKYNAKTLNSITDPVLTAVQAQQVDNFTTYEMSFYPRQVQLRTILDSVGLSTSKFAGFEAFHGELYHLYKTASGPSLTASAIILVTKWSSTPFLGAGNASVLKTICLSIYGITIP
jgi:hypothetical protein